MRVTQKYHSPRVHATTEQQSRTKNDRPGAQDDDTQTKTNVIRNGCWQVTALESGNFKLKAKKSRGTTHTEQPTRKWKTSFRTKWP
jgi:hypothetical protein